LATDVREVSTLLALLLSVTPSISGSAQRWLDPNWIQIFDVGEFEWCNREKSLQNNQRDQKDNDTNYPKKTGSIFIERFHIASR
jgi:hypothetical protein